jgi:hypothetical protein
VAQRPRNAHQIMETTAPFDLNIALQHWRERLGQSPEIKSESLTELESHVRDSVGQLEIKGLSSEESFLIATRRVGSPAQLEPEFAKMNPSPWNLVVHGLILVVFSVVCWFVWGTLQLPRMMSAATAKAAGGAVPLPAFTEMMTGIGHYLFIPPLLALGYCLYVWFRKSTAKSSWIGFFAVTTATLIFIALPTLVAVLLPVIDFMNRLPTKIFQP